MLTFSTDPRVAEEQMNAIIYYLTAFAYVDGHFDRSEKGFVHGFIGRLVEQRARSAMADADPAVMAELVGKWTQHFHEVAEVVDAEIQDLLDEVVAEGEDAQGYALSKMKLRCFELFHDFDEDSRAALLATVDELAAADGHAHPEEEQFRSELASLLEAPISLEDLEGEILGAGAVVVDDVPRKVDPAKPDHPFFQRTEWDWKRDKATFAEEAKGDLDLIERTMAELDRRRALGKSRLDGHLDFGDFAGQEPFLDGHIVVHPPAAGREYEILVLGDLHGCYSCLKAALLQVDFFEKAQRWHDEPEGNPYPLVVLLGDYIDRGRFSYNGVLRTVLQLYLAVPDHVVPLRGNHEYYVELNGRIYGAVRPSEAMNDLLPVAPEGMFATYMRLFDALPTSCVFDRFLFVHAGIPRDETMDEKFIDLASLNEWDLRFQMMWSDPSDTDVVPADLQKQSARFGFGRRQLQRFLHRIGCHTLVRGHERELSGFKRNIDLPDARLITVFSAGGATNDDLPADSSYRQVTPMAMTIKFKDGIAQLAPLAIDYERFNDPKVNAFFREAVAG
jgi:uncharacterized tellurite resistance protein B-like protein